MMKSFMPSIDVSSAVDRPVPDKAIYWPTAIGYGEPPHGDSTRFPSLTAIKARRSAQPVSPLATFIEAVACAQDRVWVLDDYLLKPLEGATSQSRIDQIFTWFPESFAGSDVRLLTSSIGSVDDANAKSQFHDLANKINAKFRYRPKNLVIDIKFSLNTHFPYVHDRFAIIDDELWHFGATVGGLHNLVNAASRGWHVDDHGAVEFFNHAWAGDSDLQGRRR